MRTEDYKAILDSWPAPLLYCDLDHVIRYMNPAAEHYYCEIRGCGDLTGKCIFDLHKPQTKDKILALVETLKRENGEIRNGTAPKTGHRVYLLPVRDGSGALVGYVKRFEDKTHN